MTEQLSRESDVIWFDEFVDYLKHNRNIMWGEEDDEIASRIKSILQQKPTESRIDEKGEYHPVYCKHCGEWSMKLKERRG